MLPTHHAFVRTALNDVVVVVVILFVTAFKNRVCRFVSAPFAFYLVNTALILIYFYDATATY